MLGEIEGSILKSEIMSNSCDFNRKVKFNSLQRKTYQLKRKLKPQRGFHSTACVIKFDHFQKESEINLVARDVNLYLYIFIKN